MTDAEIRGRLLEHLYNLRHNNGGWVPISDTVLAPEPVELRVVGGVCQQLADVGLIQWKPLLASDHIGGMAKITGKGAAAVESERSSEIDIGLRALPLPEPVTMRRPSRKIFIVHGHDEGAREAVARFLEKIGFEPIILHEQANRGRTVIEKVEHHGDVSFAVVLLTPDDFGGVAGASSQPRPRQNVLLELGYFIGRLGRENVCALKRGDMELPSDFGGVVYEAYDVAGGWKQVLARELQDVGHQIDWNAVMRP